MINSAASPAFIRMNIAEFWINLKFREILSTEKIMKNKKLIILVFIFSNFLSFVVGSMKKESELRRNCLLAHQYDADPNYGETECFHIFMGSTPMERENPEFHGQ